MAGTSRTTGGADQQTQSIDSGPLSLDEIIARYGGQWVLMRVTGHDEDWWPAEGYVVAHASTQEELLEAHERAPRATPGQPYYAFFAQHDITSGPVYEAMVKRFIADLALANPARRDRSR